MSTLFNQDQLSNLQQLINDTAAELSQSRQPQHYPTPLPYNSTTTAMTTSSNASSSTSSSSSSSLTTLSTTAATMKELRRDLEARCQQTRELVTFLESDIRAGTILTENTADSLARFSTGLDRVRDRQRTLEARQQELWNALQERPTRSEVNSTISASLLPSAAYSKTRLDSLGAGVSALEAAFDTLTQRQGKTMDDGIDADKDVPSGGRASIQYLEQRLERHMEDFVERKMRLRSRQLEIDVVRAVKQSMLQMHQMNTEGEGTTPSPAGTPGSCDGQDSDGSKQYNNSQSQKDENSGVSGNIGNTSKSKSKSSTSSPTLVTVHALALVQEKFSKEVRLVQNSLVSLRTQLRMLGRDVKAMKSTF